MSLRLVQFVGTDDRRHVGMPSEDGRRLVLIAEASTLYGLALEALEARVPLETLVRNRLSSSTVDYEAIVEAKRLLPPLDHPDPLRLHVSGTGLTHLGSADTRDRMHKAVTSAEDAALTDSMKMFRAGLEGGRPPAGTPGVQPEWFYKGNGRFIVAPEQPLTMPAFAEDGGEEPELAGLYVIGPHGDPMRVGVALGNEFSDHVTERMNYLLLAHSKLRQSSFGPEVLVGAVPSDISGISRIRRAGQVVFERPFLTGEANMSHSLANLEHHHFKYAEHRVPGDVHIHYFGTATLSFADGFTTQAGDVFEIAAEGFGRPLRNPLRAAAGGQPFVAATPF